MPAVKAVATTARHALRAGPTRRYAHAQYRQYATESQSVTRSIRDGSSDKSSQPKPQVGRRTKQQDDPQASRLPERQDGPQASHSIKQQDASSNRPQSPSPSKGNEVPLMHFIYEPHAKPMNCTTFLATKSMLTDPSHPLHIKTKRKYADFNPHILHWRIQVPLSVSKKAAIRNNAKKRLRHAFRVELKRRGVRQDGTVREAQKHALKGALLINMSGNAERTLTFTEEEAMETAKFVLDRVKQKLRAAEDGGGQKTMSKTFRKPY